MMFACPSPRWQVIDGAVHQARWGLAMSLFMGQTLNSGEMEMREPRDLLR